MATPHIRVFPHSRDEFPIADNLTTWLLTALKAQGGRYLLKSASAVADLPAGSLVLFRHTASIRGDSIVGEAIVRDWRKEVTAGFTGQGKKTQYEAYADLLPSSIRCYSPPVPITNMQSFVGPSTNIEKYSGAYVKIDDWAVYSRLLSYVAEQNTSFV